MPDKGKQCSPSRPQLKVYSPEEIEIFLSVTGDRRDIDRLLLHSMNNLNIVLIPHISKETEIFDALGSIEVVKQRSEWIDIQIQKQKNKNQMMQKVSESTATWALILFLGFIAVAAFNAVITAIAEHITPINKG